MGEDRPWPCSKEMICAIKACKTRELVWAKAVPEAPVLWREYDMKRNALVILSVALFYCTGQSCTKGTSLDGQGQNDPGASTGDEGPSDGGSQQGDGGTQQGDGGTQQGDGGTQQGDGGDSANGDADVDDRPGAIDPVTGRASPIFGITIVELDDDTYQAISQLSRKPTVRLVMGDWYSTSQCKNILTRLKNAAYTMAEIYDSCCIVPNDAEGYAEKATELVNALAPLVDIWELGNEVNGTWIEGEEGKPIAEQVVAAFDALQAYNRDAQVKEYTAITFYYNTDGVDEDGDPGHCYYDEHKHGTKYEMWTWIEDRLPDRVKQGLDYAFISYYKDKCPEATDWDVVYDRLASIFPNAVVGFGEVGTDNLDDQQEKVDFMHHFYKMPRYHDRYAGGYFWWYFIHDMVPMHEPQKKELWNILNEYGKTWDTIYQ
jgi:hypothetical protein